METRVQIPTIEVKKTFVLAHLFRDIFENKNPGINELDDNYHRILESVERLGENELNDKITDKVRLRRYDKMDWYCEIVEFENMGPWPKMEELDIRLTTGNIPRVVTGLTQIFNGNRNLHIPEGFKEKLNSFRKNVRFNHKMFPLILFPGGEVREKDYNNWAIERDEPLCDIFEYDIDDGNNRAVSYVFEGLKDAPAYFGEYQY